jgi:hypothetical protein
MNRRNALLGWTVWQVGKRVMKRKARAALPGLDDSRRPKKRAVAAGLAGIGGALWFWRRRRAEPVE